MTAPHCFPLAPTAMPYRVTSGILLTLVPLLATMGVVQGTPVLLWAAGAVLLGAIVVWVAFRPSWFAVEGDRLVIQWPLRQRRIPLADVEQVRLLRGAAELLEEVRPGWRLGAGSLFGTFGLLWTRKHGVAAVYLTRTDEAVIVARRGARPLMLTPVDAERFVEAVRGHAVP
jgi:hypothetical protein